MSSFSSSWPRARGPLIVDEDQEVTDSMPDPSVVSSRDAHHDSPTEDLESSPYYDQRDVDFPLSLLFRNMIIMNV